ncbi:pro-sigmaK processing inhibitor BofA family protein [Candidatus Woesearchaeota archaeon]|nr:pro-sigmaK processing inhibitor BofA family protein [Candidatus Woesearchaeota archaeon]
MLTEIIALVVVVCIMLLVWKLIKSILFLVLNSVVGFFALFGFNYLFGTSVAINGWSVVITAIGGIIGFMVVVGCHFLGWAF